MQDVLADSLALVGGTLWKRLYLRIRFLHSLEALIDADVLADSEALVDALIDADVLA